MLSGTRSHYWLITLGTVLSVVSFISILLFSNPKDANLVVFSFLYLSVFMASCGLVTLIELPLRKRYGKKLYFHQLGVSFRHGALVGALLVGNLMMLSQGLFYWWSFGTLLTIILIIETIFNIK